MKPGLDCASLQQAVMAGLVPAIHDFLPVATKTWMPGTSPGMTNNSVPVNQAAR
jgi:hypothetical protein